MITTTYDVDADALYVRVAGKNVPVADTRELEPGVLLDLDAAGKVMGIEILGVRRRSAEPETEAA